MGEAVSEEILTVASRYPRPTFADILMAKRVIARYLPRTPLYHYPSLSEMLGSEIYIKHENHQPVGAFKVRGGVNLFANMSEEEKRRGVITASTGNHGQSIAYAARIAGAEAHVVMPEGANPGKVEAMRSLGAKVVFQGVDFDEAKAYCERLAEEEGYQYVSSGNEPLLIAGVATETLEIVEELPDVEVILVPIGGGSGASGACIVAQAIAPGIEVIGVQAEKAPSVYLSWKQRRRVTTAKAETFAEGLQTRAPFELPLAILIDYLSDFVLVSEDELRRSILLLLEKTHNLAEGGGAAALAGAIKLKDRLGGKKVVLILSGGNLSTEKLRWVLTETNL